MRKLAIAVCYYYAEDEYLQNEACIPIQLGFDETHIELGIQKDNVGDNRGDKHPYYSELSGLYWIWKNIDAEYKGLFHHRRAFTLQNESLYDHLFYQYRLFKCVLINMIHYKETASPHQIVVKSAEYRIRVQEMVDTLLKGSLEKYDIIVPKPVTMWPQSVKKYFSIVLEENIFKMVGSVIEQKWPHYLLSWEKTLCGRQLHYANISIMSNKYFELYCQFLFGVLDEVESILKNEKYYISLVNEKSVSRKFGYLGELLTNTFVLYQKAQGVRVQELAIMLNIQKKHW